MDDTVPETVAPDASALCTNCGLCCDGLYTRLRITPEERPLALRAGKPILERDDGSYARLPCSFLDGAVCTVYAERYATCAKYTCKLLRGFVAGEVTLEIAEARIAEMRQRRDAFRAAAGSPSPDQAFYDRIEQWQALADKGERAAGARAHLAVSIYNLYANKYFRNVADPAALS